LKNFLAADVRHSNGSQITLSQSTLSECCFGAAHLWCSQDCRPLFGVKMIYSVVSVAVLASVFTNVEGVSKTIEALYPKDVGNLFLRGSDCGLNWDSGVRMQKESTKDGYKWTQSVECAGSAQGKLEVKVLINDDHWMLGANAFIDTSKNATNEIFPWFYTYSGTLTIIKDVRSNELHNTRDVIYYTPPSYYENTLKTYKNVLIMHDGQNLFNPATSAFGTAWMCQDTMDDLIIGGKGDEVLIAGVYNTADRMDEYTYIYDPSEDAGGKGDLYLDFLESTIIPLTQKNFRVQVQRETLGILGSSLGGLISCYGGWTRSTYGKVGCMSSSFWWDDQDFQKNVLVNNNPSPDFSVPHIYMDSGTREDLTCTEYTTQIYNYYLSDGFTANVDAFQYLDQGGQHSESSWGPRFHIPMEDLYPVSVV
jgi:predicted alpha/beta superfamily hydrolase